jgi:Ras-related protein Rab-2A
MASGITWHYVLKFIITGDVPQLSRYPTNHARIQTGDAAVGKSSLLIRLTDQRFLANPDPTVRATVPSLHTIATRLMKQLLFYI